MRHPIPLTHQQGTTLAEVLLVLAVIGVLTAASAHYLLAVGPRSERMAATAELAVEIRAAHRISVARRIPVRAVFDPSARLLRLQHVDHPEQVLRRYDYGRRGIATVRLSRGASISFYPNGRAASPVTITLVTTRGETAKITISMTGKVTWT